MANKSDFGELNADGSIKRDVTTSILSGRATQPGDVMVRVSGTPYFYRVTAGEKRFHLTPELRAELEVVVKPSKAAPGSSTSSAAPEKDK